MLKKVLSQLITLLLFIPAPVFSQPNAEPGASHIWEKALFGDKGTALRHVQIGGYNGGPTTTFELISPESAAYSVRTAAMSTPYCASASTNDTSAGTGARTLTVTGVNTSFAAFTETVTMNGQTSVNLATANVLGINSVVVATAGSGGVNAGIIDCGTGANSSGSAAVVEAIIPAGLNKSVGFLYTVPDNYTLVCDGLTVSTDHATAANTYQFAIDTHVNLGVLQRSIVGFMSAGGNNPGFLSYKIKFAEKTQIIGKVLAATATDDVAASMDCLLVDTDWEDDGQALF